MKLALLEELLANGHPATLRVRGGSMWPALRDGDIVTLSPATSFRPGDLAAARAGDQLLIHRVIASRGAHVELRGDALPRPDGLFSPLAKVISIRRGARRKKPLSGRPALLLAACTRLSLRIARKISRDRSPTKG